MKEISIGWCPIKKMVANFMTKPLRGSHFKNLRDYIMGRVRSTKPKHDVISVGKKTYKAVTKKSKVNGKRWIIFLDDPFLLSRLRYNYSTNL
jgi:hypothetical protein